jgi:competence protein ComEC
VKPPPVVWFVLAFGAGLATGLARFYPGPVGFGCLMAIPLLRRRELSLIPIAALLGLVHASIAWATTRRSCNAHLRPGAFQLTAILRDAGRPGVVLARPVGRGCNGSVALRWPREPGVAAGKRVVLDGKWISRPAWADRPDGIFLVRRVVDADGRPDRAARLRGWITETAERRFGARAGLVDALVLNRRGAMDPELKDAFARSGLVHLLSISGFHVGLITAWLVLLLRALRVPRVRATVLGAVLSCGYVAFLGWPAPATRAAALGLLLALGLARQRAVQPTPLLLATCLLVLLVDPWAIADLGAWLSAASLWGATTFTRWSDRAISPHPGVRTLFGSIGATLAAAPITAGVLGTVALAGILLNFAGIPIAALAVPAILLTLVLSAIAPPLADTMAGGAGLVLAALERIALLGGRIPGGSTLIEPGLRALGLWGAVLAAAGFAIAGGRRLAPAGYRAAFACALGSWIWVTAVQLRVRGEGRGELTLFFLRVGQGDAAAIRTPGSRWLMVDAGPGNERADAGSRTVVPFLHRRGARHLAGMVISHAHADHLGGAASVLRRVPTAGVLEPAVPVADSLYLAFLDEVEGEGIRWMPARQGDTWTVDGVQFTVLHPDTTWRGWGEDLNEDSVVLLVQYRGFRALFTGDAGFPVEGRLRGRIGRVQVLKAGHHGSRTATGDAWLAELRPDIVVASVGLNHYGHPAPAMLKRVAASGATLWRTDEDGTVEVRTDGKRVVVRGEKRRLEFLVH